MERLYLGTGEVFHKMVHARCKYYGLIWRLDFEQDVFYKAFGYFLKIMEQRKYEERGRAANYFVAIAKPVADQMIKEEFRRGNDLPTSDDVEGIYEKNIGRNQQMIWSGAEQEMEYLHRFEKCLEKLSPENRRLYEERFVKNIKPEKISQRTGLKTNTITSRLNYIKNRLLECARGN